MNREVLPNSSYEDYERDSFRVMVTIVDKHLNLLFDNVVCIPHTDNQSRDKSKISIHHSTKAKSALYTV